VAVLSQKHLPIGLILMGGGPIIPFTFGIPVLGAIRPQEFAVIRPARGQVVHTAERPFLDTFGQGVAHLQASGHTGWGSGAYEIPGVLLFKALEFLFTEYHTRQMTLARAGLDPALVQLWWIDTLNLQAFSIYPLAFHAKKTSSHPLLYYYSIQAVVLIDFLQGDWEDIPEPGIVQGQADGLAQGFTDLAESFAA
jgi:hypothetical protein